eukprot:3764684-Amphidinium_carterae.1
MLPSTALGGYMTHDNAHARSERNCKCKGCGNQWKCKEARVNRVLHRVPARGNGEGETRGGKGQAGERWRQERKEGGGGQVTSQQKENARGGEKRARERQVQEKQAPGQFK